MHSHSQIANEEHQQPQRHGLAAVAHWFWQAPYLLLPLAPLFWSGNFVLGRAVRGAVPPIGLAFWRWAIAALILVGFSWRHVARDWPIIVRYRGVLLLLSLLGVASFNTLVYLGLQWTQAVNGLLLQSMMPVMIVALSYVLFRETVTPGQILGIVISLVGVVVIAGQGDVSVLRTLSLNRGDGLILIAVAAYAAYSVLLRKRPKLHPLSFLSVTFTTGALLLLPAYLWEHFGGRQVNVNPQTVFAISYVVIFPSILAYFCYNRGVELVGANRAGLFIHLMAVFGSVLAVLFLNEAVRLYHGIGIGLIVAGIVLVTSRKPRA